MCILITDFTKRRNEIERQKIINFALDLDSSIDFSKVTRNTKFYFNIEWKNDLLKYYEWEEIRSFVRFDNLLLTQYTVIY